MALSFKSTEDAIFFGFEAEGPYIGMPTLFIVGNPSSLKIVQYLDKMASEFSAGFGLYLGAGGNIHSPLTPSNLELVLAQFQSIFKISRIAIEYRADSHVEAVSIISNKIKDYSRVLNSWFVTNKRDFIIPFVWPDKQLYGSDYGSVLKKYASLNWNIYVKIYIKDKLLFIANILYCYFADYDNNVAEFKKDELLYSSIPNRIETI